MQLISSSLLSLATALHTIDRLRRPNWKGEQEACGEEFQG